MADKSAVAVAYAEVNADLSKLPGQLNKVPSLMKRLISTDGLRAVKDILTGNVSGGISALASKGYEDQAEKLKELAKGAAEASKRLKEKGDIDGANRAKALSERYGKGAEAAKAMGEQAASVSIFAIRAIVVAAAAGIAVVVAAASKASTDLKTSQIVRATGEAAGWSAEQLRHMGEQLRKNSKFSQSSIAGAQQKLLLNPNIKGEQFEKALKTAANLASVLGTDLPSAAGELGDLLSDPIKAAEGGLEKYGVILNAVEQGQIRNAVAARDHARAQELVLAHLKGFDGAAAEAANTGIGGFEKLKNSVLAALAAIGASGEGIGALAGRVADLIDKFMGLQVVQDIIDAITAPFRILFDTISEFIENNRADFEAWGEYVSEIYHNLRDAIIEAWEAVKEATTAAMDFVLGIFGTSWNEIKEVVTAVLDEISLLTTNFGLTCEYVWLKIQLGAQNLWDAIRDGLAAVVVFFEATWDAIVAGAEAVWKNIEAIFTGDEFVSFGDSIADAFMKGIEDGAKKYNFGDSPAAKELQAEIADVRQQMEKARDAKRELRAEKEKRKEEKIKELEKPNKGTPYKDNKKFQFEFVGFAEMSKKIQSALFPSEQMALQKAGVAAAEKAVDQGGKANALLGDINANIKKIGMKP